MTNIIGNTADPETAGVLGQSTNTTDKAGPGIHGISWAAGVWGESTTWHGVVGFSESNSGGAGVYGKGLPDADAVGVVGESTKRAGVVGASQSGPGVFGTSLGTMADTAGVFGENTNDTPAAGPGVHGKSKATGVWGLSTTWHGVYGETQSKVGGAGVCGEHKGGGSGIVGISDSGTGVWATSDSGEAIHAITDSSGFAAIAGFNNNPNGTGAAVFGQKAGNAGHAGYFDGNVHVTKTLTVDQDAVINGSLRARVDVVLLTHPLISVGHKRIGRPSARF